MPDTNAATRRHRFQVRADQLPGRAGSAGSPPLTHHIRDPEDSNHARRRAEPRGGRTRRTSAVLPARR
jgi:hypothetical protein